MLAILIPIADVPFFPQAILDNIAETIGTSNYHVHFLTSNITDRLKDELKNLKGNFSIHEKKFPSDQKGVHLQLLDWAIYNLDLPDWIYTQHEDMFWQTKNWLSYFQKYMHKSIAIMPPYLDTGYSYKHYKYQYNGEKLIRCHDFSGLYHKESLIKNNLSFCWSLVKNCKQNLILNNIENFNLIHESRNLKEDDFLDGSDLIGMYLQCLDKNSVSEIQEPMSYYHCWGLFGMAWYMKIENQNIYINSKFKTALLGLGLESYSWCSSFCFDFEKWNDRVFPWHVAQKILNVKKNKFCTFIEKYNKEKKCLSDQKFKIKKIFFLDREISVENISML